MARVLLEGKPVSPGIAIGKAILRHIAEPDERRRITDEEIGTELARITEASRRVYAELRDRLEAIPENMEEYRDMLLTQMELVKDAKILDGARARVVKRQISASWAISETIEELINLFSSLPEICMVDGTNDIQAIGDCLQSALTDFVSCENGILAVHELNPADIIDIKNSGIEGVLTVEGEATTHAIILAKSFKIPVVSGIKNLLEIIRPGETVIVDGFLGKIIIGPEAGELEEYKRSQKSFTQLEETILADASLPAVTMDGRKIEILANLETSSQSRFVNLSGAEGIGLYRTEFAFLQNFPPREEALYQEYREVLQNTGSGRVTFRTLDVGADKVLPENRTLHEENPALGLRGIRFSLKYQDIFKSQLRALLRAGEGYNPGLLIPMVTSLQEVVETKRIIQSVQLELQNKEAGNREPVRLGIMVETPAAAIICGELLDRCDFISIGTNDLVHYLLAIDRGNSNVSHLHDPLHPAFLRIIRHITDRAAASRKPVSVCGELAGDPYGLVLLIGMGISIFSVNLRYIPAIKHFIRQLEAGECQKIAQEAVNCFDASNIQKKIKSMLENSSLGTAAFLLEKLAQTSWNPQGKK